MVRLKDIAQATGVSVMTVSKALRDAADVSAATKVRIKAVAQEMGYVPDTTAQGLRTRHSKLFGLVISSLANPIFSRVILSLEEKVHQLEQKLGAQQELLQEQLSRLRAAVVGIEQRMVSVEGRVNTQASAIRSLHGAQDQRREELLSALQRLGDLGGSRMATQLPENL